MDTTTQKMLETFLRMYGHKIKPAVDDYRRGEVPKALFAYCESNVVPDMNVCAYTRDELIENFKEKPSFPLVMKQFDTLDPKKQCVIGLVLPTDMISQVLQVQVQKN